MKKLSINDFQFNLRDKYEIQVIKIWLLIESLRATNLGN